MGADLARAPAPRRLPMFPLSTVLLPGELLPLHVFEARYRTMIAHCLQSQPHVFGVVLIARGSEVGGGDTRTDVGTLASIEALSRSEDGRYALAVRGTERLRVRRWLPDDPYPVAEVDLLGPDSAGAPELAERASAAVRRVEALLSELGRSPAPAPDGGGADTAWGLCRRLPLGAWDRQRLLGTDDPDARLELLVELAQAQAEDLTRLLAGG
jgi:Lon protease-like protein